MLNRTDLEKYRSITGLNLGQIERDYLQHLALMILYKISDRHLIFKGGTALQKIYQLPRFSEDLDFTLCKEFELRKLMEKLVKDLEIAGYDSSFEIQKDLKLGKTIRLKIKGPLYNGQENSVFYLLLEISNREKVLLEPQLKEIKPVYKDLNSYLVKVMDLKEIFAEKIRAIMTREKARDLFDINFLLDQKASPDLKLINEKLKYYKEKFDLKEFMQAIDNKSKIWKKDLTPLMIKIPDFNEVKTRTLASFKNENLK
ncbi:nucleotidyl transferase AbiEii/AbiGii toxin family protein [archaeon]|nr:nucleotidyl transferase AbiEii/AbiGii toxin family protein [archaeon]